MTTAASMRAELASVLTDPVFARSPVQARLLSYLVEESNRGNGKDLKSYSLAVEGLGKSPDFDSQADSYARVQVGRLRKSLDTFYAGEGATHDHRLFIEGGSYEVTLVPHDEHNAARKSVPRTRFALPSRRVTRFLAIGALAVMLFLARSRWRGGC